MRLETLSKAFVQSMANKCGYEIRKLHPTTTNKEERLEAREVRKKFAQAPEAPIWLGWDTLELLQRHYPPLPEYGYDPHTLEKRGLQRAERILNLVTEDARTFLELGCMDGMVSCALQRAGKMATAIDSTDEHFDRRALLEGVTLCQVDAANLQFADESFDFVFSFNAFEHFAEPQSVLHEAIRVARKGGYIYLLFGPLYMSPLGLHAYRSITVPYCQFLFPKELLVDFVNAKQLKPIDFAQVNEWSLQDYRRLWNQNTSRLEAIKYNETRDLSHLDLIADYPSCFKSKTDCFDNLVVSYIEALFKKAA